MFPNAPIYTTVYEPSRLPAEMRTWDVRPSFLQRIPFARRHHQPFFSLMPLAFEQFDMSEYDLVITTSSACAKGVITRPGALNLCYCYTPCRYLWDSYHEYTGGSRLLPLIAPVAHRMRTWDQLSSQRVDHFVAISHDVAARIRHHYRRDAEVIYPPVDIDRFTPSNRVEDFYLVVARLVPYKRIDLAITAANRLRRRLIVVGDGPQRKELEAMSGPTVQFLGKRSDEEVADLYARCRAFIFPGLDDFGIAPVEAQAAGRPVIAFARGGATETVVHGATGLLFDEQNEDSLIQSLDELDGTAIDSSLCRRNAERFDRREFCQRFQAMVSRHHGAAKRGERAAQVRNALLDLA